MFLAILMIMMIILASFLQYTENAGNFKSGFDVGQRQFWNNEKF